jgi:hypothetical protein
LIENLLQLLIENLLQMLQLSLLSQLHLQLTPLIVESDKPPDIMLHSSSLTIPLILAIHIDPDHVHQT